MAAYYKTQNSFIFETGVFKENTCIIGCGFDAASLSQIEFDL